MQRNWELVRAILIRLEAQPEPNSHVEPDAFPPHAPEVVSYHINLLRQAGLVLGDEYSNSSAPYYFVATSLTWAGHEFLDAVRRDTVWARVKTTARDKGLDLSFEVIKISAKLAIEHLLKAQ